jgi:hypothetical protein
MPVFLTDADKGKEFFIDLGDGTGAEGVIVVPVTGQERDELRRRFVKVKITRYGRDEEFDAVGYLHALSKRVIKGWKGFVDQAGNVVLCTSENIVALSEMNSAAFSDIMERVDRLAETGRQASEKN